mmetsp:Transcript_11073/g.19392  ORF Transcript_11073/g.19392 Transcript_11073/m.19392 type:complete len:199 (-) Transcript_11073:123-719(-)
MAGKNMAFALKTKTEVAASAEQEITLENAHALTLYQLRQELTRREIFDEVFGPEGEKRAINFNSLLQVLVAELTKEEEVRQAAHAAKVEAAIGRADPATADGGIGGSAETLQEKLAREKAERKAQALERSAKRQAEKAYFAKKKEDNERLQKEKEEKEKEKAAAGITEVEGQGEEEGEEEEAPAKEAAYGAWRSNVIG